MISSFPISTIWYSEILEKLCIGQIPSCKNCAFVNEGYNLYVLVCFPLIWHIPEIIYLKKEKVVFHSQFGGVSPRQAGPISFWTYGRQRVTTRSEPWCKAASLVAKIWKEGKEMIPQLFLRSWPNDQKAFLWVYLLKFLPVLNITNLGAKPLTHGHLGTTLYTNYTITWWQ